MSLEESIRKETASMSREFALYGGAVGLILGVIGTLVLQGVFQ